MSVRQEEGAAAAIRSRARGSLGALDLDDGGLRGRHQIREMVTAVLRWESRRGLNWRRVRR